MDLKPKIFQSVSVSLRTLLTVPYILLIVLAVAAVGYIAFLNGQASVNDVAHRLRNETALRVKERLSIFLNVPHQINEFNAYAIQSGELDPENAETMQRHFLKQVALYPSITSAYFGNAKGGLVGGGREGAEGALYVIATEKQQSGVFQKFGVNESGESPLLASVPNFDARMRPWYISASQKGKATWSDIYVLITGQDMAIAASRPVYDEQNRLLGVVSVDIFLSQLSKYLESLSVSPIGQVFIVDHSGLLVATSTGESLFKDENNDGTKERLRASDSASAVIRQSDRLLLETYGSYKNLPSGESRLTFKLDGEKQFLEFLSMRDPYGIDWIIAVAIPESAFMEKINAGNRVTAWLILAALFVSAGISVFITAKITNRISSLENSARALAAGDWDAELNADTRLTELNRLALSFKQMKEQLRGTLERLTTEVAERKQIEIELQSQRDFATQVINTMGQGLTVTNAEGFFEFVNPAYARLLGYEPPEMVGKGPLDVTAPEDRATLFEQRKQRQAGKTSTYESRLIRADGSVAPALITSAPRERDGKYNGAIAVITDLTGQKQIQSELRRAKEELEAANRKLEQALEREQRLARTDELTGINNRRHLFELAESEIAVAARYRQPFAVIMFDIDHFKQVNDQHGHLIGDQTLARVAQLAHAEMRKADVIGRYGGEEFIILLPMTSAGSAHILAERVRAKIAAARVPSEKGDVAVTISVGITELRYSDPPETVEELFNRADAALYRAKQAGRNCVALLDAQEPGWQ